MRIPIPNTEQVKLLLPDCIDLSYVASGGFKVVFRAVNGGGHAEAIKAIYIPSESDGLAPEQIAQLVARAQREIAALRLCLSPSIVKLGGLSPKLVTLGACTYLIYSEEFLPGKPLVEGVGKQPPPDLVTLMAVFNFLIDVIEEMIRIQYLHRDIKPANIMVTGVAERPYVILDMGIAYKVHGTELTQGATPPGTLRYMAPELLSPDYKDVMDFRCDLYSSALSIYELASGLHPFAPKPENDYATIYRIMKERPEPLENHRRDLPLQFCRIIDRCIKKNPALRYARTDLLRYDLQEVQQ
jgi:serine/threonine protein kinase